MPNIGESDRLLLPKRAEATIRVRSRAATNYFAQCVEAASLYFGIDVDLHDLYMWFFIIILDTSSMPKALNEVLTSTHHKLSKLFKTP